MKKNLIILGILIAATILGFAIFSFFRGSDTTTDTDPTGVESPFGSSGEGLPANLPSDFQGELPRIQSEDGDGSGAVGTETKLFRLSSEPVAGFTVFNRATTTVARYVDRATGHIFEYLMPNATSSEATKRRITNTTLPKIYEAHFSSDGNAVLMRTLEEGSDFVRNFTLTLTAPRATSTPSTGSGQGEALYGVTTSNLRGEILSPTVRASNSLLYIAGENSSLISASLDGSAPRSLASLGINGWRILPSQGAPLVQTKASDELPGYLYSVETGGALSKIVGPLYGLTASSNRAGTKVVYSYNEGGIMKTYTLDRTTNTQLEISPGTIAEKCLWSELQTNLVFCSVPKEGFLSDSEPDSWYQGKTHFSDYLWSYDTGAEMASLILEPESEFGVNLDATSLKLSSDERFLFFINHRDLSLWAIKLK